MDVSKPNPSTPSQTHILCRYFNMTGNPFSDFVLQAAVPKYMKLEMQPPSSTSLTAYSNGNVTQEIRINNTLQGEKPVMLKLKIVYKVNGQQVQYTTLCIPISISCVLYVCSILMYTILRYTVCIIYAVYTVLFMQYNM